MELTKEYFDQVLANLATKDDLLDLATQQSLITLKTSVDDIQKKVTRIDKRDFEDSSAFAKDILELRKRISAIDGRHTKMPTQVD